MAQTNKLNGSVCSQEVSLLKEKHLTCDCCSMHFHPFCVGIGLIAVKRISGIRQQVMWFCKNCRKSYPYKNIISSTMKDAEKPVEKYKEIYETLKGLSGRLSIV